MYKLDSTTQRSDVKFVDVYNNYINADTGETLTFEQLVNLGYKFTDILNLNKINGEWKIVAKVYDTLSEK